MYFDVIDFKGFCSFFLVVPNYFIVTVVVIIIITSIIVRQLLQSFLVNYLPPLPCRRILDTICLPTNISPCVVSVVSFITPSL